LGIRGPTKRQPFTKRFSSDVSGRKTQKNKSEGAWATEAQQKTTNMNSDPKNSSINAGKEGGCPAHEEGPSQRIIKARTQERRIRGKRKERGLAALELQKLRSRENRTVF